MNPEASVLITEIEKWLSVQDNAEPNSPLWYALGNTRAFVESVKSDQSPTSFSKACWALGHRLSDQLDWPEDHVKQIGQFLKMARSIKQGMING